MDSTLQLDVPTSVNAFLIESRVRFLPLFALMLPCFFLFMCLYILMSLSRNMFSRNEEEKACGRIYGNICGDIMVRYVTVCVVVFW